MSTDDENDDQDYANLLYHAAEDQLCRRNNLQQFVINCSSSTLHLVFELFLSSNVSESFVSQDVESDIQYVKEEVWKALPDVDTKGLPYHDNVLFSQFLVDFLQNLAMNTCSTSFSWRDQQGLLGLGQVDHLQAQILKESFNVYPDCTFVHALIQDSPYPRVFQWFHKYLLCYPGFTSILHRIFILFAEAGGKIDKLALLTFYLSANTVLPPENGYTRVFRGNETLTIEQLRDQLFTSNESVEPATFHPFRNFGLTVAVSYKHFADGSKHKMSERDCEALHRFLVASKGSDIRLWVDSKLPRTDDDSFDRWLKRGVRPFARYFTFVCPSAFEDTSRFWIQMERHIANASQGMFYCMEDGIYYMKNPFDYRTLCHKMLTLMVGRDGIPPGMRQEDEGKAVQWALGFLGDKESVMLFRLRGPRVDHLSNRDFCELSVMRNITYIIREHGELELPIERGRSWNEDNPLVLRGLPDQVLLLPTWIGFAKSSEPRKVCFLNGTMLTQVMHGGVVGLEVTLRKDFEKGKPNEVTRKVLKEIPQSDVIEMSMVKSENGEERETILSLTPTNILEICLGQIRALILQNKTDDSTNCTLEALRRFFRTAFQNTQQMRFNFGRETEGTDAKENGETNKDSASISLTGMKAVTLPWECDWV